MNTISQSFLLILFLGLLSFNHAQAKSESTIQASFDCKKAQTDLEKKICKTGDLAGHDRVLGEIFTRKIKSSDETAKSVLVKEQKKWMSQRKSCMDLLPAEEESCLTESYVTRIKELNGTTDLLSFYRSSCAQESWKCLRLGKLDNELGQWQDTVNDLKSYCDEDHDDDMGESCFLVAEALEHLNKKAEALTQYSKTCQERQNNLACAATARLSDKKSTNPWVGLYRNSTGTVYVSEQKDGGISINADTHWANGHMCFWTAKGSIKNNKLIAEKDPEAPQCLPIIEKQGSKLKIQDPKLECKKAYCGARAFFEGDFELDPKGN